MHEAVSPLSAWENYYVIIGSAAAGLTGLMFIAITLSAGTFDRRSSTNAIGTFNTPTIVHFCAALAISAILNAPWPTLWGASLLLGCIGLGGMIYTLIIRWRVRQMTNYTAVMEDWLGHVVSPLVAYTAIIVAAIFLPSQPMLPLFAIGAVALLLLFTGIHNAWDIVTYVVVERIPPKDKQPD